MSKILLSQATLVNENKVFVADLLIENDIIKKIAPKIDGENFDKILNLEGKYLIPGAIDDQVHFREPGLTHKADIYTESRAAVAGGITSFMEMPNTVPQSTTIEKLEQKFDIAKENALANYSFMFGGTNDNLDELLKVDPKKVAAIKLFLGSSTGNMLVDNEEVLEKIFSATQMVICTHCEDEATIKKQLKAHIEEFGEDIPIEKHPIIRSEEACYISSSKAIALAKKTGARLHVFHLSTEKETHLFDNDIPLKEKKITAEVCVHHLSFSDEDYKTKKTLIKWNPAVKKQADQDGLWQALLDDRIDVIATDHAPHTLEEKSQVYTKAPSGGPLVQHALPVLLQAVKKGKISLEKLVEKMCHNPAILFDVEKRGYLREGYFADLVVVNPNKKWKATHENTYYKCGWTPFNDTVFDMSIEKTFINGHLAFDNGIFDDSKLGKRLTFNR